MESGTYFMIEHSPARKKKTIHNLSTVFVIDMLMGRKCLDCLCCFGENFFKICKHQIPLRPKSLANLVTQDAFLLIDIMANLTVVALK